jgi:hypothetical protein
VLQPLPRHGRVARFDRPAASPEVQDFVFSQRAAELAEERNHVRRQRRRQKVFGVRSGDGLVDQGGRLVERVVEQLVPNRVRRLVDAHQRQNRGALFDTIEREPEPVLEALGQAHAIGPRATPKLLRAFRTSLR